ncbi:MAG: DUF92 domain-containing protein [Chloroherpetonaceae bacterium]|nr:DUF92 domain-containing protein [Chloroherpetonaceae bacterium]
MNFTDSIFSSLEPHPKDFPIFLSALAIIFSQLLITEFLKRKNIMSAAHTRKVIHILTGVLIFIAPNFFHTGFYPALIPLIFIPINLIAVRFGWFESIHGSERGELTNQNKIEHNYGTVYYPFAFLILVVLFWGSHTWVIQVSMLVLAIGDAGASLFGESVKKPHFYNLAGRESKPKTIEGSLMMFGLSLVIIYLSLKFFKQESLALLSIDDKTLFVLSISLALIATATEALLSGGIDNLFVPLSVAYPMVIFDIQGAEMIRNIILATCISFLFVRLSVWLKFLNASGGTATFLFGANIFCMGGVKWTVPVLAFFLLSSILSKVGKARKKKFDLIFEKGSQRDAGQVYANGGIAWLIMIWYSFTPEPILFVAFLGTLAAVQADTWATEIGTMLRNPKPVSIISFKPVAPGTSGGITVTGTSSAFLGAAVIALSGWLIASSEIRSLFGDGSSSGLLEAIGCIGLAGLIGSLIDSFLGATVQAMYFDEIRQKETERTHSRKEDGTPIENRLIKGYLWADNDLVNLICAISGAGISVIIYSLI